MNNRVVIVDSSESFIVRSIEKNLENLGYSCLTVGWSVDDIAASKKDFSDVIIAYIDDVDDIDKKSLIYLRDLCIEDSRELYFIGHKEDVEELKNNYAIPQLAGAFYRPVNANEVAEQISALMTKDPMMHKSHILVVDDSGTMLTTIQEWLSGKYRVSIVNSAMNAITFISKSIPDLILLDYEMPGCSGPQLLEMLRSDPRTESIPVIFLTGNGNPESVKSVLSLKPAGYLLKNMSKDYIIGQIDQFFEKQKGL